MMSKEYKAMVKKYRREKDVLLHSFRLINEELHLPDVHSTG